MNLSTREPADQQIADKSGLPSPLKWIVQLLNRLVDTLPSSAKTVVFFILLIYLLIATTIFVRGMIPTDVIEIRGSVKPTDGNFFPVSEIDVDISGTNLYVTKITHPPKEAPQQFYYEWILIIPKSDEEDEHSLNFTRYVEDIGYKTFKSVFFLPCTLKNVQDIVVKTDNQFYKATVTYSRPLLKRIFDGLASAGPFSLLSKKQPLLPQRFVDEFVINPINGFDYNQDLPNPRQASILGIGAPEAPRNKQQKQLSPERIQELIDTYQTAKSPIVQVSIIEQFAGTDSVTALILADSLVAELGRGHHIDASDYASLLTGSYYLQKFSAGGEYSAKFNENFYSQIIQLLQTGSIIERSIFVQFLDELLDSRSVPLLLDSLSQSHNEVVQQILLDVLGSFATHPDKSLRSEIRNRLQAESTGGHSQNVTRDIQRTIQLFERPRK